MEKQIFYDGNGQKVASCANVLAFGAIGDGVADDTVAIQAALDAKKQGGSVHFPAGIYKVTASLRFYSNQALMFEQGATIVQGAAINNLMMNDSTSDKGGYDATEHVLIDGCYFEGSRKTGANGCMIQIDSFNNTATWPWGNGKVDGTVSYLVEVKNCMFTDCTTAPAIGNHSAAVVNGIRIHDNVFENLTGSRGAINFQSANNVDVYSNTFIGCTTGITVGTADGTSTVHDNRFLGVTTVSGAGIEVYQNMVNGVFTA